MRAARAASEASSEGATRRRMEHEKARTRRSAAPDGDAGRTRGPRAVFAPFALVAVLSRKTGATTPTKSDDRRDRRAEAA